jgi:hypothetical protein
MKARGVLDAPTADSQREHYLEVASEVVGQPLTRAELTDLVFEANQG